MRDTACRGWAHRCTASAMCMWVHSACFGLSLCDVRSAVTPSTFITNRALSKRGERLGACEASCGRGGEGEKSSATYTMAGTKAEAALAQGAGSNYPPPPLPPLVGKERELRQLERGASLCVCMGANPPHHAPSTRSPQAPAWVSCRPHPPFLSTYTDVRHQGA